jgi:hypothetical protein
MNWKALGDEVGLSEVDRKLFWGRMFLILSYLKARQKRFETT